jgi:hypothetical protein
MFTMDRLQSSYGRAYRGATSAVRAAQTNLQSFQRHPAPFRAGSATKDSARSDAAMHVDNVGKTDGFFAAAESELPPAPQLSLVQRNLHRGERYAAFLPV